MLLSLIVGWLWLFRERSRNASDISSSSTDPSFPIYSLRLSFVHLLLLSHWWNYFLPLCFENLSLRVAKIRACLPFHIQQRKWAVSHIQSRQIYKWMWSNGVFVYIRSAWSFPSVQSCLHWRPRKNWAFHPLLFILPSQVYTYRGLVCRHRIVVVGGCRIRGV